jgi:hypothetical protein
MMRASLGLLDILAGHFTLSSAAPAGVCEKCSGRGPGWRFARALRGDWQAEAPAPASVDCVGP